MDLFGYLLSGGIWLPIVRCLVTYCQVFGYLLSGGVWLPFVREIHQTNGRLKRVENGPKDNAYYGIRLVH